MRKRSVTDFFKQDKPAFVSYDNLRKIPSYVDGLKTSQRKLIWTAFEKAAKDYVKTESFINLCSLYTNYIHGAASLGVVCEGLTQEFVNASNWAYFDGGDTGWGCRQIPVASATRYTKLRLAPIAKAVFDKQDEPILEKQYFEGEYIEPKTFMPIFPTIFLNSSEGLSTGFSSKIFSRNPKEVISYIKKRLAGEEPKAKLLPWFRNFKGTIRKTEEGCECAGVIERKNTTSYEITELPVGVEQSKYVEFLDKLCDDKVIVDYSDECDPKTNTIFYRVKTTREFTKKHESEEKLLKAFKLVKSLPENLNCIDENNRVREFKDVKEILDAFIDKRKEAYRRRKDWILSSTKDEIEEMASKYYFCKGIVDRTIKVTNVPKAEIVKTLEGMQKIKKLDGTYDYLLRLPISSLTTELLEKLKREIVEKKAYFDQVKATSIEDMWLKDLDGLAKEFFKGC